MHEDGAAGFPGAAEGSVADFINIGEIEVADCGRGVVHGVVAVPFVAFAVDEDHVIWEGIVMVDYCVSVSWISFCFNPGWWSWLRISFGEMAKERTECEVDSCLMAFILDDCQVGGWVVDDEDIFLPSGEHFVDPFDVIAL